MPLWESRGRGGSCDATHSRRKQFQRDIILAHTVGQANVQGYQFAHPPRAGEGQQARLGESQGQGSIHSGRGIVHRAGVRVQAGGHVQRQQQRVAAPFPYSRNLQQGLPHHALQGTRSARPQDGIYDQVTTGQEPFKSVHSFIGCQVQRGHSVVSGQVHLVIDFGTAG